MGQIFFWKVCMLPVISSNLLVPRASDFNILTMMLWYFLRTHNLVDPKPHSFGLALNFKVQFTIKLSSSLRYLAVNFCLHDAFFLLRPLSRQLWKSYIKSNSKVKKTIAKITCSIILSSIIKTPSNCKNKRILLSNQATWFLRCYILFDCWCIMF